MTNILSKIESRIKRKKRSRKHAFGVADKPRLTVFRSNKSVYAQLIDDVKATTLLSVSSKLLKEKLKSLKGIEAASLTGEEIAKKALAKKIKKIVFDRTGYKYHGRVKALAEGARKGGLVF